MSLQLKEHIVDYVVYVELLRSMLFVLSRDGKNPHVRFVATVTVSFAQGSGKQKFLHPRCPIIPNRSSRLDARLQLHA